MFFILLGLNLKVNLVLTKYMHGASHWPISWFKKGLVKCVSC
ncbi:hypothetical protein MNBD_ALPHA11-917 [hydrothermal vent metagenome]|uniref:Uncharacterized protein n=1 Tax=hydrothermal vent metagenome TaxID=652676 RepID=A0A3B0ULJ6_9ZZZZ